MDLPLRLAVAAILPGYLLAFTASTASSQTTGSAAASAFARGLDAEASGDFGEAAKHYRLALDADFVPAMARLGVLLEHGRGVPRAAPRAVELYRTAADAGDLDGLYHLARVYAAGELVSRDPAKARHLLARAAAAGDQESQLLLAVMIHRGVGGPQNSFAARRWLARAESGPHEEVRAEAHRLKSELDEDLLYSKAFSQRTTRVLYGVAFLGVLGLLADATDAPESSQHDHDIEQARLRRRQSCLLDAAARSRTTGDFVQEAAQCR